MKMKTKPLTTRQQFNHLAEKWHEECGHLSFIGELINHYAYQRIINMGPAALPHILNELEKQPDHWFHALRVITGENPVLPEHQGNIKLMTQDWLNWAKGSGLLAFGRRVSRAKALQIASDILERAERERIEFAEREQGIGKEEE